MNLEAIQSELYSAGLDGWLFFDHHVRDPLAYRVLGLPVAVHVSRRWYYFIPAAGMPRGLVHRVEPNQLDALPGEKSLYARWQEQEPALHDLLGGARKVAMQYSPRCAVPYVAHVDAGTVELVRGLGVEVVSSAELIQIFEARWTPAQLELHLEAVRRVDHIRDEAFDLIKTATRSGEAIPAIQDGPPGEYLLERLAGEAIQFVLAQRYGPFHLDWWPFCAHSPWQAPEAFLMKYRQRKGIQVIDPAL